MKFMEALYLERAVQLSSTIGRLTKLTNRRARPLRLFTTPRTPVLVLLPPSLPATACLDVLGCVSSRGKKGRGRATLIGTLGPPVTPSCFNSNRVSPVIHGTFVLGVAIAWLHPSSPHDATHPDIFIWISTAPSINIIFDRIVLEGVLNGLLALFLY
ncbi:hypothetical protein Y032_0087g2106 [Ancylostoma ceylanicum]|uniref:Uncharacterized protein n=1 Tax=Ancylostoma ceylanicum TaxID=53326 RepID=A0A016TPB9_9BILA|nr:hypothetical protein Y032_0087g2106 [Ancylostoma ceylanicum]